MIAIFDGPAVITMKPFGERCLRGRHGRENLARSCRMLLKGCSFWGVVDSRAADLLERESDPRKTIELLPDWERAFGLPDPCFKTAITINERQIALVHQMTMLGAQSRDWFKNVATYLGYTNIKIDEFSPWICGISRCGRTLDDSGYDMWEIARPEIRFYWRIRIDQAKLIWFRCGSGECGVDPHLRIDTAEDLECLFLRWKPAQTQIVFDYSGLTMGGPMAGTP